MIKLMRERRAGNIRQESLGKKTTGKLRLSWEGDD
jgi:hypothetical protein